MTYSLCFCFAVLFLSLFGFVSNSSATSHNITCTTLYCYNHEIKGVTHNSTSVGFAYSYVLIEIQSDKVNSSTHIGTTMINNNGTSLFCPQDSTGKLSCFFNIDNYYTSNSWSSWMVDSTGTFSYSVTFYDSFPIEPCSCPEPDPCPEVPENPYDDKLDKIYNAIIIGSATMLVIYFFYVMYSWYMGGRT